MKPRWAVTKPAASELVRRVIPAENLPPDARKKIAGLLKRGMQPRICPECYWVFGTRRSWKSHLSIAHWDEKTTEDA